MKTTAIISSHYSCPVCNLNYKRYQTGYMYMAELLCSKTCLDKYIADRKIEVIIDFKDDEE